MLEIHRYQPRLPVTSIKPGQQESNPTIYQKDIDKAATWDIGDSAGLEHLLPPAKTSFTADYYK